MTPITGLDCVLSGFSERVAGVRHTVAVSGELPPERADQLAAMVAGVVSLAQGLSACTDAGPVLRTIVQMGRSLLFVMALGDGDTLASLAAMVQPGCDVGEVAFEMTGLVGQVGAVLTPTAR